MTVKEMGPAVATRRAFFDLPSLLDGLFGPRMRLSNLRFDLEQGLLLT
jgi:hypothetical protein